MVVAFPYAFHDNGTIMVLGYAGDTLPRNGNKTVEYSSKDARASEAMRG